MIAPRPGGLYALRPVGANEVLGGRMTVTAMQRRLAPTATVAGVNGDFFTWREGLPSGVLMHDGALERLPHPNRSSLGIAGDGVLSIARLIALGTWRGSAQGHPPPGVHRPPRPPHPTPFTA